MLSFTTPLLLAGLLLVPAIRWLHRGGPQRPRVPVASLVLWRRAAADSAGAGERRPPDPAWRRRALLASLLVVALAGPQLPDRSGRVTVWVDDSLSMLTREARGSRIEAGLADVRSALAAAGAGEVEVRTLGDPWRRYGTLDDATAADIVAGAGREEPAPPPAALLRKDRQHWLLTDGADAAILQWQDGTMPDRSVRVAQVTRNAGLELGSARRSLEDPGSYELLFKITNGGTATEARQLVVETDAGVVGRSAWTVDAGESALVRATIAASASVRASLQPADALAADDSISLDLAALRPRRIAADPRCPPGLLAALRAHPAIVVAAPGTPGVEAAINCGAEQRAPGIATLHVRTDRVPSAPDGFLQWSSSLSDVDHIALDGESLQVAGRVDPRPGDKVLLTAGDDALIVERAGAPAVIETSLDFAAADATAGSATPLLADLLLAQLLGTRPLDDVVLLDR
ncbi:MAG: BatA domain-containing protein, partial [Steroidobacteraceae bacterium]|nr:BatA domain-containing protein [Steroidobacteraceae bacterium]